MGDKPRIERTAPQKSDSRSDFFYLQSGLCQASSSVRVFSHFVGKFSDSRSICRQREMTHIQIILPLRWNRPGRITLVFISCCFLPLHLNQPYVQYFPKYPDKSFVQCVHFARDWTEFESYHALFYWYTE